jgi:hypothetical protein
MVQKAETARSKRNSLHLVSPVKYKNKLTTADISNGESASIQKRKLSKLPTNNEMIRNIAIRTSWMETTNGPHKDGPSG